jgi:hypothetical protein
MKKIKVTTMRWEGMVILLSMMVLLSLSPAPVSACTIVGDCRVTGGGNNTSGIDPAGGWDGTFAQGKSGKANNVNRYTFGGQAGANTALEPQPQGEWTHHQQRGPAGSFVFHGDTIDAIFCSDPYICTPARQAPAKQIDFAGWGRFNNIKNPPPEFGTSVIAGESRHWFEVHIEDLGEPGSELRGADKKNIVCEGYGSGTDAFADPQVFVWVSDPTYCRCADFYRIRIFASEYPSSDEPPIYEAYGYLDGGNLQIHPPTGFDLK